MLLSSFWSKSCKKLIVAFLISAGCIVMNFLHHYIPGDIGDEPKIPAFEEINDRVRSRLQAEDKHKQVALITTQKPVTTNRFQYNFQFSGNRASVCFLNKKHSSVGLIVIITTSYGQRMKRDSLRNSWLKFSLNNTSEVRYIFILGQTESKTLFLNIMDEMNEFKDIAVGNFLDSYRNLTMKTLAGFDWAREYCEHARFLLKTDDDVYVNIPGLLNILEHKSENYSLGYLRRAAKPVRTKGHKWYVSHEDYPNATYPDYLDGLGYILSMTIVKRNLEIYPYVSNITLEDVFVGLCLKRMGYEYKNDIYYIFVRRELTFNVCFYKYANVIAAHGVSESLMETIWKTSCKERKSLTRPQWISLLRNKMQGRNSH